MFPHFIKIKRNWVHHLLGVIHHEALSHLALQQAPVVVLSLLDCQSEWNGAWQYQALYAAVHLAVLRPATLRPSAHLLLLGFCFNVGAAHGLLHLLVRFLQEPVKGSPVLQQHCLCLAQRGLIL